MRAVVLADTHVRAGSGARRLPAAAYDALRDTDVILHAGDVLAQDLLDELRGFAPVHAVLGNNDYGLARVLPDSRVIDLDGIEVAMVHDSGPRAGRAARLHRWFPRARVVVFGHSHMPLNERGIEGQLLFNPGSPTQRRMAPTHTIGILEASHGRLVRADILDV